MGFGIFLYSLIQSISEEILNEKDLGQIILQGGEDSVNGSLEFLINSSLLSIRDGSPPSASWKRNTSTFTIS